MGSQVTAACPSPVPPPQKVNLCSWSGVDDHLSPLTPQVPSGRTGTTRGHCYEQGGKGLENVTAQDLRTQWDWFTMQIYM